MHIKLIIIELLEVVEICGVQVSFVWSEITVLFSAHLYREWVNSHALLPVGGPVPFSLCTDC